MNIRTSFRAGAVASATLLLSLASAGVSYAFDRVPSAFIDNGPGQLLPINFGAYCRNKYGSTARQDLGGDQGWNHWSCKVGAGGVAKPQLIGIDLYDVCRNRYGNSFKPVNNTGNGYNWYCKRR